MVRLPRDVTENGGRIIATLHLPIDLEAFGKLCHVLADIFPGCRLQHSADSVYVIQGSKEAYADGSEQR